MMLRSISVISCNMTKDIVSSRSSSTINRLYELWDKPVLIVYTHCSTNRILSVECVPLKPCGGYVDVEIECPMRYESSKRLMQLKIKNILSIKSLR